MEIDLLPRPEDVIRIVIATSLVVGLAFVTVLAWITPKTSRNLWILVLAASAVGIGVATLLASVAWHAFDYVKDAAFAVRMAAIIVLPIVATASAAQRNVSHAATTGAKYRPLALAGAQLAAIFVTVTFVLWNG